MPVKPSNKEEEHFAQMEFERRKHLANAQAEQLAAKEKAELKVLHWMHCPKDGSELLETTLRGVKVDICSTCGGMWLDAGELNSLTEADKSGVMGSFQKLFQK
ncbi:MAG: zf-TFIIB domain-containing protein [Holophaga sp.]|nr:zf-TFIIB domain-containing protein [Holophaga sp.]